MNLSRTATGALLNNQGADSYDSLGAGGNADSSALNTSALKNYTNDKFSADSESFATDRAMDVKSFVSYVDGLLSKYRFRNNAVTVGSNGAGSRRNPIYVTAAERECTAGSVTYAMSGNSQGYLATVTPASNGLYYVDYTEKYVPDETTGGGTGGSSGPSGPSGSENLGEQEIMLMHWGGDSAGIIGDSNGGEFFPPHDYTITIPQGVKILKVYGESECLDYEMISSELKNIDSGKFWCSPLATGTRDYYGQDTKYVAVTPGKTYNLRYYLYNGGDGQNGSETYIEISYSKSINEKVPDIIDY